MNTIEEQNALASTQIQPNSAKYLSFKLSDETYGVAVLAVREIIRMQKVTLVPQVPEYIRGIINLRGKVIPVMSMRLKFGLGEDVITDKTCIVVVLIESKQKGEMLVGLIVDSVEEVANIDASEVDENPNLGTTAGNQYILGIAKLKSEVMTLLNIEEVILSENLDKVMDEVQGEN